MSNHQQAQRRTWPVNNLGEPTMSSISTINHHQQSGVVLVVSLLILLVLTLLGISSLDGSIMEEKMAANTQTANTTFQAAESAIRQTFYEESKDPIGAFENAQSGDTETYDDASYDLTAGTVMSIPSTARKEGARLPDRLRAAFSEGEFVARRVEITGNANVDDINSSNTQGYLVFPMMATP